MCIRNTNTHSVFLFQLLPKMSLVIVILNTVVVSSPVIIFIYCKHMRLIVNLLIVPLLRMGLLEGEGFRR